MRGVDARVVMHGRRVEPSGAYTRERVPLPIIRREGGAEYAGGGRARLGRGQE